MQFFTLLVFVGVMIELSMSQAPTPNPTRTPTRAPTRFPTKNKIKYVTTVRRSYRALELLVSPLSLTLLLFIADLYSVTLRSVGKGTHGKRCSVCCDWNARFYCNVIHHLFEEETGLYLGSSKGLHQKPKSCRPRKRDRRD